MLLWDRAKEERGSSTSKPLYYHGASNSEKEQASTTGLSLSSTIFCA